MHSGTLATGSFDLGTWHAHIAGRKRWKICPESEAPFLYVKSSQRLVSDLQTLPDVNTTQFPLWQYARCFDHVVKPGEIVYIPPRSFYEWINLDSDTVHVGLTGRLLAPYNYADVLEKISSACSSTAASLHRCYSPHYENGFRTPPPLIQMDHEDASVCAKYEKIAKLYVAQIMTQSMRATTGPVATTKAQQASSHHQRLLDTSFYRSKIAAAFGPTGECELQDDTAEVLEDEDWRTAIKDEL